MTKLLTFLFACLTPMFLIAQNTVPNSSFEIWKDSAGTKFPVGYPNCSNFNISYDGSSVYQYSDPHTGNFSVRVEMVYDYNGNLHGGSITSNKFPVDFKPLSMNGYWKYFSSASNNHLNVQAIIFDSSGNTIGTATANAPSFEDNHVWTEFSANVSYTSNATPAYASIHIGLYAFGPFHSDYGTVDDIVLSALVGIEDRQDAVIKNLSLFPSVADQSITIEYGLKKNAAIETRIIDCRGVVVKSYPKQEQSPGDDHRQIISVESLIDGLYFCQVYCNGINHSLKFVVKKG